MKKIILSITLLATSTLISANSFNMPGFNNGNSFNNGSNWNMPTMNWDNNTNGTNWSMPSMNWGNSSNNNGNNWRGSNWNMPTMNWGNSNSGSNWNIPTMNWGNPTINNNGNGFTNGSNWIMPNMNWGNGSAFGNSIQPWNFGNSYNNAPNAQYRGVPAMPVAPQFMPRANVQNKAQVAPVAKNPVVKATTPALKSAPVVKGTVQNKIPMPSEVKGTILAPENKSTTVEAQK